MIATAENIQTGTVLVDIKTGREFTVHRLPSKKLRSFGTYNTDGNNIFIYRNELKSMTIK